MITSDEDGERQQPTVEEAEEAVRTLLRFIGEDVDREGLRDTPRRVAKAYKQLFSGYRLSEEDNDGRVPTRIARSDDMLVIRDLPFYSHCEHHMVPIIGKANIGIVPDQQSAELEQISHVIEIYARRLQTQEAITAQVATAIDRFLKPKGIAVLVEASHMCMAMRGIQKVGSSTITTTFVGTLEHDAEGQAHFMTLIRRGF